MRLKDEKLEAFRWQLLRMELETKQLQSHMVHIAIMRDPETGNSRGFGYISYDSFEAFDSAIEAMNGQYLCKEL